MEKKSIAGRMLKGTIIIVLVTILGKLAAFASEAILAAYLGTNYQSDAYYMVSGLKDVVYPMLSVGIWKVFLPIYKEKITLGQQEDANRLTNKVITLFTLASAFAVVLIILLADPLASLIAPGFTGETRSLYIELLRISAPMYVFILVSAVYASMLQSHERFFGSQIREVASHLPLILAAVFLYRIWGIKVLAVALIFGGATRLLIELPFVNWGYRYKPDFKFKTPEFELIKKRLPSALISECVTQLNMLVDKIMASLLQEGTVSSLNYGHRLVNVFSGLLSSAVSTAMYPPMIELIAQKKREALSRLVVRIMNIFCILMVPVTIACVMYRRELVSVVYERGSFDANSAALTSSVFALYSIGLFFIACNAVVTNLFYGSGNTKTPMLFSVLNLVTNLVFNLILIGIWGASGLALATSLSAVMSFGVRLFCARRYVKLDQKRLLTVAGKTLLASVLVILPVYRLLSYIGVHKLLTLILGAGVSVPLYLVLLRLFKVQELSDLVQLFLGKLRKSNKKNV